MRNFYYANEISRFLAEELEEVLPLSVKSIFQGDFTILPTPDSLDDVLPAVIVSSINATHQWANMSLQIMYSTYQYRIFYAHCYKLNQSEDVVKNTTKIIEIIANKLTDINFCNEELLVQEDTKDVGGVIHQIEVTNTSILPIEEQFFQHLNIPVSLAAVDITIQFRTKERRKNENSI